MVKPVLQFPKLTTSKMKLTYSAFLAVLALGLTSLNSFGQDGQRKRPEGAPGGPGHRPAPPLIGALDANHDGEIDAKEIENAAVALKALDKNGDGKLTADEIRPPRPEGGPEGRRRDGEKPKGPGARDGEKPKAPGTQDGQPK
jgi:hypothetical protein